MRVYTVEELTIIGENKAAKLTAEKLAEYLIKFTHEEELNFSLPEHTVIMIDGNSMCTQESDINSLIDSLKNAHTIYFKTSHDICADGFGTEYWIEFLEDNDTLAMKSSVVYKALSHDECYDEIYTFKFSKDHIGAIPFNAKNEDLEGINLWWCFNGSISIFFDGYDDETGPVEYREEFLEFAKDFYAKFVADKSMDYYLDYDISEQFEVPFDKVDEFISYLQKAYDLSVKFNGKLHMDLKFIAIGEHRFAVMCPYVERGVIKCEYCNY